ncbi:hypothetical protein [Hyalangium gracile]|nr:hypothetical protein [Hyalangium gracile]
MPREVADLRGLVFEMRFTGRGLHYGLICGVLRESGLLGEG